jgi:hypothetical protein
MSFPQHPDSIIIQNPFYPKGLKEIDIYNYYQQVKPNLLREVLGRELTFWIMTDINKPIVRRKAKEEYLTLNKSNYDSLITGRTVSIHSGMRIYEDFGIIDVDIDPYDGFKWARKVTRDVYDYVMEKMPVVTNATIRFTGKGSFHVVCHFNKKMKTDVIKFLLEKFLRGSILSKVYTVGGKRRAGIPNLDLGRNCLRCNYITLHSLSIIGLRCMKVEYNDLMKFNPREARIK